MSSKLLTPTKIVYSKRRTLSISIKSNGDFVVHSPKRLSEKVIYDFITQKSAWIIKHRQSKLVEVNIDQIESLKQGDMIDFKGKKIIIEINQTQKQNIIFDSIHNRLILNSFTMSLKELYKWYVEQAMLVFQDEIRYWSFKMNLVYFDLKISNALTKWGSCNSKNSIFLNWRLILFDLDILQYVVIHELAHIKHKNHSKEFWNLVEKYDPDWKLHRKALKNSTAMVTKYANLTKIF